MLTHPDGFKLNVPDSRELLLKLRVRTQTASSRPPPPMLQFDRPIFDLPPDLNDCQSSADPAPGSPRATAPIGRLDSLSVWMHHIYALASGRCRVADGSAVSKRYAFMPTPAKGASAPSKSVPVEYQEILVRRDGNRPISFAGQTLAKVSMSGGVTGWSITAALYNTRGGKFVAAISKANSFIEFSQGIQDPETAHGGAFHKAQVFDTFDEAISWFRPGRLTDALRKQLGLDEPERIE